MLLKPDKKYKFTKNSSFISEILLFYCWTNLVTFNTFLVIKSWNSYVKNLHLLTKLIYYASNIF